MECAANGKVTVSTNRASTEEYARSDKTEVEQSVTANQDLAVSYVNTKSTTVCWIRAKMGRLAKTTFTPSNADVRQVTLENTATPKLISVPVNRVWTEELVARAATVIYANVHKDTREVPAKSSRQRIRQKASTTSTKLTTQKLNTELSTLLLLLFLELFCRWS